MGMELTFGQGPVTMSSREIAEVCEKQHKHVLRDIKAMLEQIGLDEAGYAQLWTDPQNGQQYPEYRLPRDLIVTLITGYRADLRYRLVKRLEELEAAQPKVSLPDLSDPLVLRTLLLQHTEKLIEAEKRAEVAEERAEAAEEDASQFARLSKAEGSLSVTEAAKSLGIRPQDLFKWMAANGWIYKRPGSAGWLGYSTRCNAGDLVHKVTTVQRTDGADKVVEQVRVSPQGMAKLAKRITPTARLVG